MLHRRLAAVVMAALLAGILTAAEPPPPQPVPLPKQPAILKFSFGPEKSPLYPGFIRVTDKTVFTPALGYGWSQAGGSVVDREWPDALFRSFISGPPPFCVTLPDGAYGAWFVIGDNMAYPLNLTVSQGAPGQAKTLIEKKLSSQDWWTWYFSLQDVEWDDVQSVWDTYVNHKFKPYSVEFHVSGGKMQLTIGGWAPVCCLIVYPKSLEEEAKQAIEKLTADQRADFDKIFKLKLPAVTLPKEALTPQAQEAGLVVFGRNYMVDEDAPDRYELRNLKPDVSLFAAQGQTTTTQIEIVPLRDLADVKVSLGELKTADGAVFPAEAVEIGWQRYRISPNLPLRTGSSLSPVEIIKRESARLHANVPQRIWLTFRTPADAKAGAYSATITVTAGPGDKPQAKGSLASLPIKFKVLPFTLDPASRVARGAYYYFPGVDPREDEALFWRVTENDLKFMADNGFNSVPGLPDFYYITPTILSDGQPGPGFLANVDRFVAMYRKCGLTGPLANYGDIGLPRAAGLPANIEHHPDQPIPEKARKFLTNYISGMKAEEKKRGWPEIVIYATDEAMAGAGGQWGVKYLRLLNEIKKDVPGGFRVTASLNSFDQVLMIPLLDCPMPNGGVPMTQEIMNGIRAAGHQLWFYNIGWDRFVYGFYVWRTGATGRFQWHFDNRSYSEKSNPYNCFDHWPGVKMLFGFSTREGIRLPSPQSQQTREGIEDLEYLVTLEKAIAANPGKPEAKAAREWLNGLRDRINVSIGHYWELGMWDPAVYDELRWEAAQQIMRVQGRPMP